MVAVPDFAGVFGFAFYQTNAQITDLTSAKLGAIALILNFDYDADRAIALILRLFLLPFLALKTLANAFPSPADKH